MLKPGCQAQRAGENNQDMIYKDYSIKALAAAVILQAAREARKGNQDARRWLQNDGLLWADAIGIDIDPDYIAAWIARGCKVKRRGALMLGA